MEQTSVEAEEPCESPFKFTPIWSLSDDLLSKIFAYLNPKDRFQLAEVCPRWAGVSRVDWLDIISLDLSSIPTENVGPIVQLCPKLESITAQDCELNIKSVTENLRSELTSLSSYRVFANASVTTVWGGALNAFLLQAQQQLPHLEELVLSEFPASSLAGFYSCTLWNNLPGLLKRLQLNISIFCVQYDVLMHEGPVRTIDCLILQEDVLPLQCAWNYDEDEEVPGPHVTAVGVLFDMPQLRELSIGCLVSNWILTHEHSFALALNQLEVLSIQLNEVENAEAPGLLPLLSSHPTLRILIITGAIATDAGEILIPPRRRYPNGFGSDPLLHVFIGGQIAEKIRFARALNDGLEIHPINLSMPAFLEQPKVTAIFNGSWIGEMIKKGENANARLWDYDARIAQSVLVL